jgi:replicative DNA helicase
MNAQREKSTGRSLPQNLEAELSVLGGILLDNHALNTVAETVRAEDFYREGHGFILSCMMALADRAEPIDIVTLSDELKKQGHLERVGGAPYLASLLDAVPTAANIAHYARIVHEKAMVRRMIRTATEIAEQGYNDVPNAQDYLDQSEQKIFEVAGERKREGVVPIKTLVKATFQRIEQLYARNVDYTGVRTGFKLLDDLTSGLQAQNLIIVAGRPGMGKTSFCLNVATNAATKYGTPTAVFSLEMSSDELVTRMLCSEAMIDQSRMRTGRIEDGDWKKLISAAGKLSNAPLFIDDTPALSIMELRAKARRLSSDSHIGLVIIDYLQLMRSPAAAGDSREREISEISRSLKALAKELQIPVMALSQLNRSVERREDRKPKLADLRESGAIEQDADMVLFIDREELYKDDTEVKGLAEVIVGKHRNGPTGSVPLKFFDKYTLFVNLEKEESPF